jgi:hypothetical protein
VSQPAEVPTPGPRVGDVERIRHLLGVLEMHCAYALGASGMISDNEIRALLEKGL